MTDTSSTDSHLRTLWLLIGLGVLIRLAFLGVINLLPEEAYYWNYSRHIDIGYLDHPPMVAWLIYAFEYVLGRSELAVRLPAFLSWFVMAIYMYRLARELFDKESAVLTLLLLSALPIYMSVGCALLRSLGCRSLLLVSVPDQEAHESVVGRRY